MFGFKKSKKATILAGLILCSSSIYKINADFSSDYPKNINEPSQYTKESDFEITADGTLKNYKGHEKKVIIPNSVKQITFGTFMNKSEIEEIILPNSLEKIDEYAFYSCTSMEKINIPNNVKHIGRLAFGNCTKLKKANIGKSLENIEEFIFWGCDSLENISISSENEKFASLNGLLYSKDYSNLEICPTGLKGVVSIPEKTKNISNYAFFNCKGIKEIQRPGNEPISIEEAAFYGCDNLNTLGFANFIESIESCAFAKCTSLQKFTIGKNMKNLGSSAFLGCKSLKTVISLAENFKIGHNIFNSCPQIIAVLASKNSSMGKYVSKHPERLVLVV